MMNFTITISVTHTAFILILIGTVAGIAFLTITMMIVILFLTCFLIVSRVMQIIVVVVIIACTILAIVNFVPVAIIIVSTMITTLKDFIVVTVMIRWSLFSESLLFSQHHHHCRYYRLLWHSCNSFVILAIMSFYLTNISF